MKFFAVIRTRGDGWNNSARLEEQPGWDEHAAFMNGLQRAGFIAIGGPLEGTPDVLLIMRARSPDEIVTCLQDDPWTHSGLLRLGRISEWTLRLGSLA